MLPLVQWEGLFVFEWPRVALARESGQWRLLLSVESAAGDGIFNFQIDPSEKVKQQTNVIIAVAVLNCISGLLWLIE